jgi:hypothetical protein
MRKSPSSKQARGPSPKADQSPVSIKPVKKKIGEPRDNLRRRQEWFQRRLRGRSRPEST